MKMRLLCILFLPCLLTAELPSSLNLRQALALSFENNYEIRLARIDPLAADQSLLAENAAWDPSFFVEMSYTESDERQNALEFTSTGELNLDRSFYESSKNIKTGISGSSTFGSEYSLYASMSILDNTIIREGTNTLFDPEYESRIQLDLKQPILKDFGPSANLLEYRIAESNVNHTRLEQRITTLNAALELTHAYYDLVFGQRNVEVKKQSVVLAKQLLEENEMRLEAGKMTPVEVSQAKVRVGEANEELILAENFLRERRIRLMSLLLSEVPSELFDFTVDESLPVYQREFDSIADYEQAKLNRCDYHLAKLAVDDSYVRQRYARNQKLPRLDFVFSLAYGGLERNTKESYNDLFESDRADWSAGVVFSMPIGNRRAKHEYKATEIQKRRAELYVEKLELDMMLEVQNTNGRIASMYRRLDGARNSVIYAREAWNAELELLDSGKTTTYNVAEAQKKLEESQTRELSAKIDLVKSICEHQAVTGTILQNNGFFYEDWEQNQAEQKEAFLRWHYDL